MVHDVPGCYGSRTSPSIKEKTALGEREVTRVTGCEGTDKGHCGKAILKTSGCTRYILAIINGWGCSSINVSVEGQRKS